MTDSIIRHSIVFIPLFTLLYIILTREGSSSLLIIFFIFIPYVGEIIQLGFPKEWEFQFEIQDIIINYVSSIIGITGGMLICQSAIAVTKKQ